MARSAGRGLVPPIPAKIKKTILHKTARRSDTPIPKNPRKTKKAIFQKGAAYGTDHIFGEGIRGIAEHS